MTPPLHIGLLAPDLRMTHGWGAYSRQLIEALRDLGARLTVVASRNTPQIAGVDVLPILPTLEPRQRWMLPRLLALRSWTRDALSDCDAVHATVEPFAPLAVSAARGGPVFVTGHGSFVRVHHAWRWPTSLVYARAFRRVTLVCVSRYTARAARGAVPGARTVVVNNAVDAERFAVLPALREPKRGPTVLSVGAVKARKGTLELVQAMARVRERLPDARCVILGKTDLEPAYAARVRAEIDRLGLADAVDLPGRVPEDILLGWYGAADVFVLPSLNTGWKFEGYGLALVEAGAAGLPVIGTRDCGAEDAVDDGVTGLLVPQTGLPEALADAIVRLLGDPDTARRMGQAGRARAHAYDWTQVGRRMLALYAGDIPQQP